MNEITLEEAKTQIKTLSIKIFISRLATFIFLWTVFTIILYMLSEGKMFPLVFHIIIVTVASGLLYLLSRLSAYKQWMWDDAQNVWLDPLRKLAEIRKGYEEIAKKYPLGLGDSVEGSAFFPNSMFFREYIYERNKVVKDVSLRDNTESLTQVDGSGAFTLRPLTRSEVFTIFGILVTTIVVMIILDSAFSNR